MKRFLAVLWMFALLCGLAFARGPEEAGIPTYTAEKPAVLFVAKDGNITDEPWKSMISAFREKHPETVIRHLGIDISDGGIGAMTAYVAAGIRPLYQDYAGRVGAFKVEEYALDLSPYVDFSDYYPEVLETVTVNGKILAIPLAGTYSIMSVNTTILAAAGFDAERCRNWTPEDFLEMARLVRDNTDKTPLAFFASSASADYLYNHIFAWYGADIYDEGYTQSNLHLNDAGLKAFRMYKTLYEEGFIPKESAAIGPGDYLAAIGRGEAAVWCGWLGWNEIFRKQRVENEGTEWFEFQYVPYPKEAGLDRAPIFMQNHFILAPRSDYPYYVKGQLYNKALDEKLDALYGDLALHLRDVNESQMISNSYPMRKNQVLSGVDPMWENLDRYNEIIAEHGPWDWGLSQMTYSTVRGELFPRLQAIFSGKETPEEALEEYVKNVNRILAEAKIPWIEQ